MMKCTCGSTNLFQTSFSKLDSADFTIQSQKNGFFNGMVILPEVWVCKDCRQILFRVPEKLIGLVKEKPKKE